MDKKKELRVRQAPQSAPLYEVYFENGGELPGALTGRYTSRPDAQKAIDTYLMIRDGAE